MADQITQQRLFREVFAASVLPADLVEATEFDGSYSVILQTEDRRIDFTSAELFGPDWLVLKGITNIAPKYSGTSEPTEVEVMLSQISASWINTP